MRDKGELENENQIEGRNVVLEALRSQQSVDKLLVLEETKEGALLHLLKEGKKRGCIIQRVSKKRLDQISQTGRHQGVIAFVSSYPYMEVEEILERAKEKGEPPFLILLDGIEDPHNLGAIIRSANLAGAHGVILPKRRAVGITAVAARASAGAVAYTPVARVTNLSQTMEALKEQGIWFVCGDMKGDSMYEVDLKGPIGLVMGNEGSGVSRLVKEHCDFFASIPMKGEIESLNVSVATGVLAFEISRQRSR